MEKRLSHNHFKLALEQDINLQISSEFDSGNLEAVNVHSVAFTGETPTVKLELLPALEPFNPMYSTRPSSKTFFHFNFKTNTNIELYAIIRRMGILSIIQSNFDEYYQLCVGSKASAYQEPVYKKIRPPYMSLSKQGDEYSLEFKMNVQANQLTFFAYHFPYSYEKLCHFLHELKDTIKEANQFYSEPIYYKNQLLIESVEARQVNLLTITALPKSVAKRHADDELGLPREPRLSRSLFPFYDIEDRPYKFNKPYIMLTCRVHPGETSSSFALEGLIKKLLDASAESEFLRRTFVFLIVPMVNPDGVFHGTYRMDTAGHNLNRFYNNCVPHKQPSIFAIQSLIQHHYEDLVAFFDIHSHPQLKGSFFYGNSFSSIYDQIETQLFAKLLSTNSECFAYQYSSFSEKNMNAKDINDVLTKDGSARVFAYKKMVNGIHCYTIQMGYHGCSIKKPSKASSFKGEYRRQNVVFQLVDYYEHGAAVLNTIAQLFIQTFQITDSNESESLQIMREELGKQIHEKEERFRMMDGGLMKKMKAAHSTIYSSYYSRLSKKYPIIQQSVKHYLSKGAERRKEQISFQAVNSLNLISERGVKEEKISSCSVSLKRGQDEFSNYLGSIGMAKNPRIKLPSGKQYKDIIKIVKEKVNITPVQFTMPSSQQGKNKRRKQYEKITNLNLEALPRIEKKKLKILSERSRALRQRRVASSLNSQKLFAPADHNFNKLTIENQMNLILDFEAAMNNEEQQQANNGEEFNMEYNPGTPKEINPPHNELIFRRGFAKKHEITNKLFKNYQTERVNKKGIQTRSNSKQRIIHEQHHWSKVLPRLDSRVEKMRSRFDLQLQMKEKYDREYQLEDINNWKLTGKEMN